MRRSAERAAVLTAIDDACEPIGSNDIAATIGAKAGNVRFLLHKLLKDGEIEKAAYGTYRQAQGGGVTGDDEQIKATTGGARRGSGSQRRDWP